MDRSQSEAHTQHGSYARFRRAGQIKIVEPIQNGQWGDLGDLRFAKFRLNVGVKQIRVCLLRRMFKIGKVLRALDFDDVLELCIHFRTDRRRIREHHIVL